MTTGSYDIQTVKAMLTRLDRRHLAGCIGAVCVAALLSICAVPVEHGWSYADILLSRAIGMLTAVGLSCTLLFKTAVRLSAIDALVLIIYAYFILRCYLDATYPAEGMAIHATYAAALYFALRILFSATGVSADTLALLILAYAAYEAFCGIYQCATATSRHPLYLATGTFNNPGPYSASLVMGLSIACAYLNDFRRLAAVIGCRQRWLQTAYGAFQAMAVVFTSVMMLTMSRTAFVAAAICLFIIFRHRMGKWKWIAIPVCAVICVGLYFIKSGSADGRLAINYVGLNAMGGNPLYGHGVGSFLHKFAETTESLAADGSLIDLRAVDVMEYAFNEWLLISVELGAAGLALMAAIVAMALRRMWKASLPLSLTLITIMVFSFFSYPVELLPYRIIAIISLAFAANHPASDRQRRVASSSTSIAITAAATLSVCVFMEGDRVKALAQAEDDFNMMKAMDDPAFIKDYHKLLPQLEDDREFLFCYARILAKAGRHNDSNEMLRLGTLISNDPMFHILQGNNYRDMGATDLAEKAYIKAYNTMPNRIYPLFRLMNLHEQAGDSAKARAYAKMVIDFHEKITSPAVNEMKTEAQNLLIATSSP